MIADGDWFVNDFRYSDCNEMVFSWYEICASLWEALFPSEARGSAWGGASIAELGRSWHSSGLVVTVLTDTYIGVCPRGVGLLLLKGRVCLWLVVGRCVVVSLGVSLVSMRVAIRGIMFRWLVLCVVELGCRMCVRPSVLFDGPTFPCGQCVECRLKYSREWAMRAMHEASLYDDNCTLALTYDPKFLPRHSSLVPEDCVKFMKRLRKSIEPKKVRHMYAGEYGEINGRPHYHFCLFGLDFADKVYFGDSEKGFPLFRSASVSELWPFGLSTVGGMSFESAAYIARYIMKKRNEVKYNVDAETGEMYEIVPEFFRMSKGDGIPGSPNRYGLGSRWWERYKDEVIRDDAVRVRGAELKPPRYYDEKLKLLDAAAFEVMKVRRERKYMEKFRKSSLPVQWREVAAREVIAVQRLREMERIL